MSHFCEGLFRMPEHELERTLESRFGHPLLVRYSKHPVAISETRAVEKPCLLVQRKEDKKLMRFFEPELTDNVSNPKERLYQRMAHKMQNDVWDNYN